MGSSTKIVRSYSTEELADWIKNSRTPWWMVDGDPRLTQLFDFPCTREKLSQELSKFPQEVHLLSSGWLGPDAHDYPIPENTLEPLPDAEGRSTARTLHLSWSDIPEDSWMLYEYLPLSHEELWGSDG